MRKKYLVGPFLCTLSCWIVGNGTISLLPLYAIQRGASTAGSGLFLAFAFGCLALGTFAPGMLPGNFSHRRMVLTLTGVAQVTALLLTSRTTTVLPFAVCCGAFYFTGGVTFTQATVLAGQAAPEAERGTAMGILGMTNGLGSIIGGLGGGWLAGAHGFSGLWVGSGATALLVIVGALLSVEIPQPRRVTPAGVTRTARSSASATVLGTALVFILVAHLALSVVNAAANLGRSLMMSGLGFSVLEINSTQSLSGAVALCLSFVLGWLSDKVGRRWVLVGSYVLASGAMLFLGLAHQLWHFYVTFGLVASVAVCMAVGPAYVMDVVPPAGAARGVSLFQGMFWVGNIAGPVILGLAFEHFGTSTPILCSALFPLAGVLLLMRIRQPGLTARVGTRGPSATPSR